MRGRHKSIDKSLKKSISWLESLPNITKVIFGFTESCRHKFSPGHIRFKKDVNGGIKINGYSGTGVIDIFIKIEPIAQREQVKTLIKDRFD